MAHLLAEAVDQRGGVGAGAGLGDEVVGGAVLLDVALHGIGEEPVEEIGEREPEFPGDFGERGVAFEDFGERFGGGVWHGESPWREEEVKRGKGAIGKPGIDGVYWK